MSSLMAHGIKVRRGERFVVDGVDVSVAAGELVGLIGPNGAGKTSLLRSLAWLTEIEAGSVTLDDIAIGAMAPLERAKKIAYVEQSGAAAWPVSVADLVGLGRLPHRNILRGQGADDREAVLDALRATDCATLADRSIDTLSSGERSRVLLARALAGKPAILLLDEPVAALDPSQQLGIMALLSDLAAAGMGIIAVLHDLPLASRFCHRLVLLQEGRVLAQGEPQAVLQDRFLAEAFAIRPVRGTADGQDYVLPWQRLP
jgi:iron complex transport system ATP-binding protein